MEGQNVRHRSKNRATETAVALTYTIQGRRRQNPVLAKKNNYKFSYKLFTYWGSRGMEEIPGGLYICHGQVSVGVENEVMTAAVPQGFEFIQYFTRRRTQIPLALPAVSCANKSNHE